MQISTKGRYALQMMLDLALHNTGEYIVLQDVAGRQGITVKYLEQIAAALSRVGFVQSCRGKAGGYRLTRRPHAYSVGEILRAVEGDLAPVSPRDLPVDPDSQTGAALALFWQDFAQAIDRFVDGRTLEDLCDTCAALNGGDYCI